MLIRKDHRFETEHLFQFGLGELRDPLTRVENKWDVSAGELACLFGHQCRRLWAKQCEIGTSLPAYYLRRRSSCTVRIARIKPCDLIAVIVTQDGAAGGKLCVRIDRHELAINVVREQVALVIG